VIDSGTYTVTRRDRRGGTTTERGAYASVWRILAPPMDWVMTKDHLYPATKKTK
jgi:hypothetical protein